MERFEDEDGRGPARPGALTLGAVNKPIPTDSLRKSTDKIDEEIKKRKNKGEFEMKETLKLLETQGRPKFANLCIELECPRLMVEEIKVERCWM